MVVLTEMPLYGNQFHSEKQYTRLHSSRVRTACSLSHGWRGLSGGSLSGGSPRTETPLDRDHPGQRPPPQGTWDQAARQEVTSYRDPHEQNETCE